VHRNQAFLAALHHPPEKEAVLAGVRKEAATIVASKDHMVGMVRNDDEAAGHARHAMFSVNAVRRCVFAVWCIRYRKLWAF
jgi:hypothetical protein